MPDHALFRILAALTLSLTLPLTAQGEPMTFRGAGNGGNCRGCAWVAAEGKITTDTPLVFRKFVEEHGKPYYLALQSPGGNLVAGIELGQMIRKLDVTTWIAKTEQMAGEENSHLEQTAPGVCVSACAFAFMGGTDRIVTDQDLLGVHQFYAPDENPLDSESAQAVAGLTLLYTIKMGIDPRVIVAASSTAPDSIYWFDQSELVEYGLDTGGVETDPWRLEPYKQGLVLTTVYRESAQRSVATTLFCRVEDGRWRLLLSEETNFFKINKQMTGPLLEFEGRYRINPAVTFGKAKFAIYAGDIEFERKNNKKVSLSMLLPDVVRTAGGQDMSFDPDLAHVFGRLLSVRLELPSQKWLSKAYPVDPGLTTSCAEQRTGSRDFSLRDT